MGKTEKKESTKSVKQFNYRLETGESKTAIILRMASEGANRDEITDCLCSINPDTCKKSAGGSISNVLKMYGLREVVKGSSRAKKTPEEKILEGKEILKKREKALNGS